MIASYIYKAIDDVLVYLLRYPGIKPLRLGSDTRMHPALRSERERENSLQTVCDMEDFYDQRNLFATLCMTVSAYLTQNLYQFMFLALHLLDAVLIIV